MEARTKVCQVEEADQAGTGTGACQHTALLLASPEHDVLFPVQKGQRCWASCLAGPTSIPGWTSSLAFSFSPLPLPSPSFQPVSPSLLLHTFPENFL